jgi:hypothetical protein
LERDPRAFGHVDGVQMGNPGLELVSSALARDHRSRRDDGPVSQVHVDDDDGAIADRDVVADLGPKQHGVITDREVVADLERPAATP